MTDQYREFAPSPALEPWIECFWMHGATSRHTQVLPDGCIDIVFSRAMGLQVVGTMTRPLLAPGSQDAFVGVRFHPGMARCLLAAPIQALLNRMVPIEDLWGKRARLLEDKLRNALEPADMLSMVRAALQPSLEVSPLQSALHFMARNAGRITLREIARQAGVSQRHLRRRCIEETGVTPKQLARIARFRRACSSIHSRSRTHPDWATLALQCGYYDQSHLIRDFQEFSGCTPREYVRQPASQPAQSAAFMPPNC